ncbi:MAG: carboxylate--amine ligase [Acidobacteria bacterium]|nr:carboxylate--amine ligase [Acidobacteriota bacterium]
MRLADTSVPVVVLKAEDYGALGIIRSLGRLGVRVYGVEANPSAPGLRSRYCAGKFIWNIDTAPVQESLEFLHEVARKLGGRPILIPTGDASSVFVAEQSEALQQVFLFPLPPPGVTQALYDKKQMYFTCKKFGIPTAETAFPQSRQDVLDFLQTADCPIVLKAIDPWLLQQRTGVRMVIAETKEKLLEAYEKLENPEHPNLMLQEYIPGGEDTVWMFNGYFNAQSECLFGITGRKIRLFPVYTGMTSLGICLKNETVDKNTRDLMKAVGYRGILDIGHRYDARNGQYKILDVNPRIGATFRLFVATNGMDVTRALYLDLSGQPVPPSTFQEGRKWFVEDKDVTSSYHYHRDGKLTFGQWVGSFRGVEEAAYFTWDDPLPFTRPISNLARQAARRFSKKKA